MQTGQTKATDRTRFLEGSFQSIGIAFSCNLDASTLYR
jgi:hypothetical protein